MFEPSFFLLDLDSSLRYRPGVDEADAIIVGAGYAGLACAQAAASRGLRTLVLERKPSIGHAPHTTGILVKEAADRFDFPLSCVRKIRGVRLYSPSLRSVDLASPGYYFLAADTPGILRWLANSATQAGAQIRCQTTFHGTESHSGRHHLPYANVSARFLVGADGARSNVARLTGLSRNVNFLLGLEGEWEGVEGLDPDRLHVFLDSELAPGYIGWAVPGVGVTQIGLATRERATPALQDFVEKLRRVFDFSKAREVSRRGGLIPCGGTISRLHHPNILLLGDASGTVSPLTAGGIHPALELGRMAGVALSTHLLDHGPHPSVILQGSLPRYRFKSAIRSLVNVMPPPNWLYDLVLESSLFRRVAQTIFFHHRGLFSPEAWRDLLRQNPPH